MTTLTWLSFFLHMITKNKKKPKNDSILARSCNINGANVYIFKSSAFSFQLTQDKLPSSHLTASLISDPLSATRPGQTLNTTGTRRPFWRYQLEFQLINYLQIEVEHFHFPIQRCSYLGGWLYLQRLPTGCWTFILMDILIVHNCPNAWTFPPLFEKAEQRESLPSCILIANAFQQSHQDLGGRRQFVYLLANCPCWKTTREKTDVYLTDCVLACMLTGCLRGILDFNIIPRQNSQRHHLKMCRFCEMMTKDPRLHTVCRWIIN